MAYQQRTPASLQTLSKLVPGEIDGWLKKHDVALINYMNAIGKKNVIEAIDDAAAQDFDTLSLLPRAVKAYVVPAIKPAITNAAETDLVTIFATAQARKAEAFAKANAAAAAKVMENPKIKAEKETAEKIQSALLLLPSIIRHGGDTTKYLANWRELVAGLNREQHQALCASLAKKEEKKEVAIAIILLAKIKNPAERRQAALAMKG